MKKEKITANELFPYEDELKKISIDKIEQAIAKAITKLSQGDYLVDIKSINFDPDQYSFSDEYEIKLRLKKVVEHDDDIPF